MWRSKLRPRMPSGIRPRDVPHQAAREAGEHPVPPLAALDGILVVPGEQLVATVAGQHHLHRLGGEPRHHVGGDGRGIAERLVEMPREVLEVAERLGSQHQLVVLRREGPRDLARVRELVVLRLGEPDGERLHRRTAEPRHRGDDGARVHAPAQEGAEGNVAHEVQADRLVDERGEPLGELRRARPAVRLEAHVPVALDARGGARPREQAMAGLELLHARDDALRGRRHLAGQEMPERGPVQPPLDVGKRQERLQLGAEIAAVRRPRRSRAA